MGVAIVAIPSDRSHVWELSSEKVPHLTLLFLGDQFEYDQGTVQYLEHATSNFEEFFLSVDRRGVLGEKSADVLFFNKSAAEPVAEFRRWLLENTEIRKAYESSDQYPEWIPHLTMGFPETPAKPDKREYPEPGILSVRFDRIALWVGDYEGVEFPLKPNSGLELAMTASRGEHFLSHYGVKGMKWGVIRDRGKVIGKAGKAAVKEAYKPSGDAVKAQRYMARAKLGGVRNLDNREMQHVINRMRLERDYKELYGERQWHNAGKKWASKFVTDVLRDAAASWLSNPFARGRRSDDGPARTQVHVDSHAIGSPRRRRAISS